MKHKKQQKPNIKSKYQDLKAKIYKYSNEIARLMQENRILKIELRAETKRNRKFQ